VLADRGQRRAEIDRRRGLADAALLVGDGQDARTSAVRPGSGLRFGERHDR
jgi:hypothetical protein